MIRFSSLLARSLPALLLAGGLLVTNMQAQDDAITVRVPFPFTVGSENIPPGTYQFSLDSGRADSSPFLLSILDVKTGETKLFNVRPEHQSTLEQRGRLTFDLSAGRSILAGVHFPGSNTFSELIERRRAADTQPPQSLAANAVPVMRRGECAAKAVAPAPPAPGTLLSSSTSAQSK